MGNAPSHFPPDRPILRPDPLPIDPRNGILPYIPGEITGEAVSRLPKPHAGEQPVRTAVVEVPDVGAVLLTWELSSYRHYRNTFWQWRIKRADKVAPPEA